MASYAVMPIQSHLLTSILSLTVAGSMALGVLPGRAVAANQTPSLAAAAGSAMRLASRQTAPASVLGLEGKDARASEELTVALRKAFKSRGLAGGDEATLVEMRLAMGCDENLAPGCMAEGGEALGVERLVYGTLNPSSRNAFDLQLQILDVATKEVVNQLSQTVPAKDLEPAVIDATALAIVNGMLGSEENPESVPAAGANAIGGNNPAVDDPPVVDDQPRERKYWVGRDKNGPRWKKAGFYTGVAIAAAGGITIAVTGGLVKGKYEPDYNDAVADAAAKGLISQAALDGATEDDNSSVCDPALTKDADGNVPHKPLATACDRGRRAQLATNISIGIVGAGLLTTLIFGTLLLVHKKKPGQGDAARRRQLRVSIAPTRGGGSASASFHF